MTKPYPKKEPQKWLHNHSRGMKYGWCIFAGTWRYLQKRTKPQSGRYNNEQIRLKSVFTDFQKCCSFCANHRYYEIVNETVLEHKSTASVSTNLTILLNHLWGLD